MWFDLLIVMAVVRGIQFFFRRRTEPQLGDEGAQKLNVARSFRALYGGNIYQGLRIPDAGGRGFQFIDVLLLTEKELYAFSVQGSSRPVRSGWEGVWLEMDTNGNEMERANAVSELKDKAALLTQYIARRGVVIPKDFIKLKVVFVDPMARPEQDILLLPEVLSYDRWVDIQEKASASHIFGIDVANSHSNFSSTSPFKQLHYILCTAPTWDRLDLRQGGVLLGDFLHFKGQSQNVESLSATKRSKISHYEAIHKWTFWGIMGVRMVTEVKMVCHQRDHRQGTSVQPTKVETLVPDDVEIVFQVEGSKRPSTFQLRDVAMLWLHA